MRFWKKTGVFEQVNDGEIIVRRKRNGLLPLCKCYDKSHTYYIT